MDAKTRRALLKEEHRALVAILDERGVAYTSPIPEEVLDQVSDSDLKRLIQIERDLARTPSGNRR